MCCWVCARLKMNLKHGITSFCISIMLHIHICISPLCSFTASLLQSVWCGPRWDPVTRWTPWNGGGLAGGVEGQSYRHTPCKFTRTHTQQPDLTTRHTLSQELRVCLVVRSDRGRSCPNEPKSDLTGLKSAGMKMPLNSLLLDWLWASDDLTPSTLPFLGIHLGH